MYASLKLCMTHAVSLNKAVLEQADFSGLFGEDDPVLAECSPENALLKFFLSMENFPPLPAVKQIMTTAALIKSDGNQSVAARLLGISQPAMSKRVNS
jgi:transcriptional regulator with AAA-type ATPase domain